MLEELRIQGLGVIDDATLALHPGLTVLTGETGAGKTMVLQGLGLLFGGRSDSGLVRPGADRAVVDGRLVAPAAVLGRVEELGAELDDGVLLVTRQVSAEGRSRATVGGRPVPAGVLAELAESMVAVHGQSDQQRLLRPAEQRAALDRFAGEPVTRRLGVYVEAFGAWSALAAELDDITSRGRERAQEAAALRAALDDVERVQPRPGEDAAVAAELSRLSNVEALHDAAAVAQRALAGADDSDEPDALGLLATARRVVAGAAAHDLQLAALEQRMVDVGHQLTDLAADVSSYLDGLDVDPHRLEALQQRKAELTALVRRHAPLDGEPSVDAVLAFADRASRRLLELDDGDDRIGQLRADCDAAWQRLATAAADLSGARAAAAAAFGTAVGAELAHLAMPHAEVVAVVSQRDKPGGLPIGERQVEHGPTGVDDVEIQLRPHPGAPLRAVQRGASGGELSRVMLAIEVVFAGADTVPTMVFDEVDAGVGGEAAIEVGRRLARLARDHQVVVVTHLAQVAAFADRHLRVVKAVDGAVTSTGVVELDDDERARELARMLAGLGDSELGRAHAGELLALAAAERVAT